jgi:hypothetical protein
MTGAQQLTVEVGTSDDAFVEKVKRMISTNGCHLTIGVCLYRLIPVNGGFISAALEPEGYASQLREGDIVVVAHGKDPVQMHAQTSDHSHMPRAAESAVEVEPPVKKQKQKPEVAGRSTDELRYIKMTPGQKRDMVGWEYDNPLPGAGSKCLGVKVAIDAVRPFLVERNGGLPFSSLSFS